MHNMHTMDYMMLKIPLSSIAFAEYILSQAETISNKIPSMAATFFSKLVTYTVNTPFSPYLQNIKLATAGELKGSIDVKSNGIKGRRCGE